jgi:hypothetical protein
MSDVPSYGFSPNLFLQEFPLQQFRLNQVVYLLRMNSFLAQALSRERVSLAVLF